MVSNSFQLNIQELFPFQCHKIGLCIHLKDFIHNNDTTSRIDINNVCIGRTLIIDGGLKI